jgi:hypothetical protein
MPGVIFRKTFLDSLGGFDPTYRLTAADSELVQRALLFGHSVFIPEIIAGYRVWRGGLTSQKIASKEWLGEIEYWTKKNADIAAKEMQRAGFKFNKEKFKDNIYAKNLIAGCDNLLQCKKYRDCIHFIFTSRFPRRARIGLRLRLLKSLYNAVAKNAITIIRGKV